VFLQTSVEWHCPDPSTLILANGSGKPENIQQYQHVEARHENNQHLYSKIINISTRPLYLRVC